MANSTTILLLNSKALMKCFPLRNYSFVEFRSIDEARRAKEGLQGRLFNDPRIQIRFSSSELAPGNYNTLPFPGFRGPRPGMFFAERPIGPLELYRPGHATAPNIFPRSLFPNSMPGPGILMRPFGPQGFDSCHGSLEFHDSGGTAMHSNWGQQSPLAPGILPSVPQTEDQALKVDYNRPLYEEPMHHSGVGKSLLMLADEPCAVQSASLDDAGNSAGASQVGVSLTPELISTLASLIPSNNQSLAAGTVQMASGSTSGPVSSSAAVIHDALMPFEGWRQHQAAVSIAPLGQTSNIPAWLH